MDSARRAGYETRAQHYQGGRVEALREEIDTHLSEASRLAEVLRAGGSVDEQDTSKIVKCKLTSEQAQSLCVDVEALLTRKRGGQQAPRANIKVSSPQPIEPEVFERMVETSPLQDEPQRSIGPEWTRIARLRDAFKNAVFVFYPGEDHPRCYKFVFASLNPVHVSVLPLHRIHVDMPEQSIAEFVEGAKIKPTYIFSYTPGLFESVVQLDGLSLDGMGVLLETCYKGTSLVFSWDSLLPVEHVLAMFGDEDALPMPREPKPPKQPKSKSSTSEPAVPSWASAFLKKDVRSVGLREELELKQHEPELSDGDSDSEHEDDAAGQLHRALEARREAMDFTTVETLQEQFRSNIIGGTWSVQRSGRDVYGIRCDAKRASRIGAFCAKFNLGFSVSFSENVFSTLEGATLSKLWMARLGHLEQYWCACGCPESFPLELPPFAIPAELQESCKAMKGRALKRQNDILGICP
eukprot:6484765-Amphidinium_carterae.1